MAKGGRPRKSKQNAPEPSGFSEPIPSGTRLWLALVAVVGFALLLDLSSMPPHVTMEDSGLFIVAAYTLGIPHPPGYPLYTLGAHLFTWIPIGTVAWRVALFSAVTGAGACGFVALSAAQLTRQLWPSVVAGLAYAASRTLWSQSIIAEVYSLNALFFFALLWQALRLRESFTRRGLLGFAFVYGLSLSNHWPLIGLASGAFLAVLWPHRREILRQAHWIVGCVAAGLVPYSALYIRSQFELDIAFLGPIRNLRELWDYVLRSEYAAENVQPHWTWNDGARFLGYFLRLFATEFWYCGALVAAGGAWLAWRRLPRPTAIGLLAGFLSSNALLGLALRMEYHELTRAAYSVFQLIPFGVAAIWMAVAARWALEEGVRRGLKTPVVAGILVALVPLPAAITNWRSNDLRNDTYAMEFAALALESLPERAVLLMWGDADIGPVVYAQVAAGIRSDVLLTTQAGVSTKVKPFDRRDARSDQARAARLTSFIEDRLAEGRRVLSSRRLDYVEDATFPYDYVPHGLFDELVPKGSRAAPALTPKDVERARRILDGVAEGRYGEQWMYHRAIVLRWLCNLLARHEVDHPVFATHNQCRMARVEQYRREKRYADADPLLQQVLADSELLLIQDRLEIAVVWFVNRIYTLNSTTSSGADRVNGYQEAVDRVAPLVKLSATCRNSLALSLLEARKQIPLELDLEWMFAAFGRCPKHRRFIDEIRLKLAHEQRGS